MHSSLLGFEIHIFIPMMNPFLVLKDLSFQADEISQQSSASALSGTRVISAANAGLKSGRKRRSKGQACFGDSGPAAEGSRWGWGEDACRASGPGGGFHSARVEMQRPRRSL